MNPTELQPSELMQIAADFFKSERIHYRVVGSMANVPENCRKRPVKRGIDSSSSHSHAACFYYPSLVGYLLFSTNKFRKTAR